ncbi:MAG TPA: alpha/beta fold hydrolase, partial [Microthrixaceae bacterium]|nr:alpha/beta fold hydrolase [Microthrixaceae bacterium]
MFVLIHGAWQGAWCWSRLQVSLRGLGALSIAVDLPGHGEDRTPIAGLTLSDYADRVIEVLDDIDEPVTLVGHSLGGATISTVAERRPERIAGLVYLCALLQPSGATPADLHRHDPDSALVA